MKAQKFVQQGYLFPFIFLLQLRWPIESKFSQICNVMHDVRIHQAIIGLLVFLYYQLCSMPLKQKSSNINKNNLNTLLHNYFSFSWYYKFIKFICYSVYTVGHVLWYRMSLRSVVAQWTMMTFVMWSQSCPLLHSLSLSVPLSFKVLLYQMM